MSEFNKSDFGVRLLEALKFLGITRREFAAAIGAHAPNVSMWINGNLRFWDTEFFIKAQCAYPHVNFFYVSGGSEYGKVDDVPLSHQFYNASQKVGVLPIPKELGADEKELLITRIKELENTVQIFKATLEQYRATINTYEEQLLK